jgi:hypothetical protein
MRTRRKIAVALLALGTGLGAATVVPQLPLAATGTAAEPSRPSHIEGWIAFLRTELHITDSQAALWAPVAQAMRDGDKAVRAAREDLRALRRSNASAVDRLAAWQHLLQIRAESLGGVVAAARPLYAAMGDEQRQDADALLGSRFGMMRHGRG